MEREIRNSRMKRLSVHIRGKVASVQHFFTKQAADTNLSFINLFSKDNN